MMWEMHWILAKRVAPPLIGTHKPIRTNHACELHVANGRRIGRHGASAHPVNTRQFGLRTLRGSWKLRESSDTYRDCSRCGCIMFLCLFYVADACRWDSGVRTTRPQHAVGGAVGGAVGFERSGMSTTALECHCRTFDSRCSLLHGGRAEHDFSPSKVHPLNMFQVGEVLRSDAHGGGGDAVPHWCSSTSVTLEMLMSSLSLSATRGKFEVLFGFKCHAELAAMDGASGSFKNKYVWHRCGGCVDIFTCVWLKVPLSLSLSLS